MKVNIKDRVMQCFVCGKWVRKNDTGKCEACQTKKKSKKSKNTTKKESQK